MIDYTFHGVKIALIRKIKNRESETENPIYWRITYQRKQAYYFTGLKFDENEWDDFLNRKMQKHRKFKESLQSFFEITLRPVIDQLAVNNSFSFEALDALLNNRTTTSVNEAFKKKIESLEMEYSIGNASIYRTTLNALQRFKYYQTLRNRKKNSFNYARKTNTNRKEKTSLISRSTSNSRN